MTISDNFEIVLEQLKYTTISSTVIPQNLEPYKADMILSQKVQTTYRALLRSTRMNNRLLSLVNSFYLGQLLEDETLIPAQRTVQVSTITTHYYRIAVRVFYLFEHLGVQRIFGTRSLTLTIIRRLKIAEYQTLIIEALNLSAGAEILSEG